VLQLCCRRAASIASDSGDERDSKTSFANGTAQNKTRKLLFKKKTTKVLFSICNFVFAVASFSPSKVMFLVICIWCGLKHSHLDKRLTFSDSHFAPVLILFSFSFSFYSIVFIYVYFKYFFRFTVFYVALTFVYCNGRVEKCS